MENLNKLIKDRYSTVIFSSKQVSENNLALLFDAARWAPSAFNEQPWRFIVGIKSKNENYEKLFTSLVEANQNWAKYAPVLVLSVTLKNSSVTNKPNKFAQYDTGMAVANIITQATSLGLYVHQMGGFSENKVREYFDLGDKFEIMSIMAIGYKGEIELFPDDLKERELKKRTRKTLDEILL